MSMYTRNDKQELFTNLGVLRVLLEEHRMPQKSSESCVDQTEKKGIKQCIKKEKDISRNELCLYLWLYHFCHWDFVHDCPSTKDPSETCGVCILFHWS
jgi:hypothetical protein